MVKDIKGEKLNWKKYSESRGERKTLQKTKK